MFKSSKALIAAAVFLLISVIAWLMSATGLGSELTELQAYDVVILNGKVMDPESGLDSIRNVGIVGDRVRTITGEPIQGRTTIDATGLVVAPGFIDLHWHGRLTESYQYQAMDGVTSSLELEVGTSDIDKWYRERDGKSLINYGASIGHIPVRMAVMNDPGDFLPSGAAKDKPADDSQVAELKRRIELGLKRGAPAVGLGIAYTAAASHWEILEIFRVASRYRAPCHVHIAGGDDRPQALEQVIAAAAITGAPLHVVHIQSSGGRDTQLLLRMIAEAQTRGLDVTTECYPYTAGATRIESAIFDGMENRPDSYFQTLQWFATGERLTRETFLRYRKTGGLVIVHSNPEEVVRDAVANPLTMIASDGFDFLNGQGHPRSAGTFSRILARYVREAKVLTLMDALKKMTVMPGRRLEERVPSMKNKGRIREGADADVTVFDPNAITDKATFEKPAQYSQGVKYVLVNGVLVVRDGKFQTGIAPGRGIRARLEGS